ncbi:MAG: monothiol glutaredoxin, Grx4 family [Robiginitomaculum sp.]|nr:MAG: monothiol glutaredoxin, Grx4 family [Robiginitomaculum sp.]
MTDQAILDHIKTTVEADDIVLYMKGTPVFPQCGFSSLATKILDVVGAEFSTVNVLEDMAVREGIKEYSQWPTVPQLYIKGEFVGGSDIMREMYESGELKTLMQDKGILPAS